MKDLVQDAKGELKIMELIKLEIRKYDGGVKMGTLYKVDLTVLKF